jgi:hypothetical protein
MIFLYVFGNTLESISNGRRMLCAFFLGGTQFSVEYAVLSSCCNVRGSLRRYLHVDGGGDVDEAVDVVMVTANAGWIGGCSLLPIQRSRSLLPSAE